MSKLSNQAAPDRLRAFVERLCNLAEEKKAIADDIKSVLAEAKALGFDTTALRQVAKEKQESREERAARAEIEAITDLYRAALGMLEGTPLGEAARTRMAPDPEAAAEEGGDPDQTDIEPVRPEVNLTEAREAGHQAARDGLTIIQNPFVAGDPRRAAWDEGWCAEAGSDGMDIPPGWRRTPKPKKSGAPAGAA